MDNAGKREGDREGIVGKIGGSFARNIPGVLIIRILPPKEKTI